MSVYHFIIIKLSKFHIAYIFVIPLLYMATFICAFVKKCYLK